MNKNLNDIIPPSRRRAMGEPEGDSAASYAPAAPAYTRSGGRSKKRFPFGTAIVAILVIAGSVGALFAFAGAKVTVTPSSNPSYVSGNFIATASGGDLPFEVISVDKVGSVSVPSEGTETVNQAAQGTITISNLQGKPQQLIKNTRFQTTDGLIFRIHDSVTVPAAKGTTPGTADVTAYADVSGDKYNVGPANFTLPGLSGSAAFSQVTAKSSAAMSGGFSGPRPSVSKATRDAKAADVEKGLATDIQAALEAKVPEGYVLVPGASKVTYEPQPDQAGATGTVQVSEKATAVGVIFPKDALAKAIALQVVASYAGQPVTLESASELTLAPTGDLPAPGAEEFAFALTGNTTIIWQVDPQKIAAAVAGKNRNSAQVVLSGFPELSGWNLVLRPFWATSFPADPAKISVTVEKPAPVK